MQINASFTTPQGVYIGVQADSVKEVQVAIDALLGGKAAVTTPYNGICAGAPLGDETADVKTEAKDDPKAKKSASASTKKSSEPSASTATKSSDEPKPDAKPADEAIPELDYVRDVQKRVLDYAKENGRDKTTDMLSRYGVKSAKDLKTQQWPDFIAYIDKVAAGDVDPTESDVA